MDSNQRSEVSKAVVKKWKYIDKKEDKALVIQPDLSDIIYVEQLIEILAEEHEYSYARFHTKKDFNSIYQKVQSTDIAPSRQRFR